MRIYPAIDIRRGQCVRLRQGDFSQETVYHADPAAQAKLWLAKGCSFIHVVDLDGAQSGAARNNEAIRRIINAVPIPIQVGGGIRSLEDAAAKIQMGVSRVILGTAAVQNPALARLACETYGASRVAAGVDARDGFAAVSGWASSSRKTALDCCLELKAMGVKTVIYTDIAKDGMMTGPNVEETARLIDQTGLEIIASGGVSRMEDLERLRAVGVAGVIVGQALYTGAIDLAEAVAAFERI
ncbi:MAG: 1-(5-phosphoribosyl)-5-[(5-phosphoribosylamino)methylideneamino]imidazole-4-carboxamide isomerase [Clostridiales bacterium]|jgi:phosphoribosylformimino-5-aminoimidazole carboxamide ribotide isomerase|nr:1-(5-phosphoribosyl)-5-[(5-phosphoribosylamino)methylideneamino]imidazole-4-carboxamide isomerase [Clostridiales bacterium]